MVAQASGVDVGRHEVVAEGVHWEERGVACDISEVVLEYAVCEFRAACGFCGYETDFLSVFNCVAHEGERDSAEVGATAEAGDYYVGVFASHFHLFFSFEADDCLVECDVAEDGAECVFAVGCGHGEFYGFGYGGAERALVVGVACEDVTSGASGHGGGGGDLRAECLHDGSSVGFLVEADFDLVYGGFESEYFGRVGESASPLSCACLGGDVGYALLFTVVGLRECGVEFVGAYGADAFVFEVDVCGGVERFFEAVGTDERSAAIAFVHIADLVGDVDPLVGVVKFLLGDLLGEDGEEVFGGHWFTGFGVEGEEWFIGHYGRDVEPLSWDLVFVEEVSFLLFHRGMILCLVLGIESRPPPMIVA